MNCLTSSERLSLASGPFAPWMKKMPENCVAALARNHVDAQAALRDLGALRAGVVRNFLGHAVVQVDAAELALPFEQVEPHAVHHHDLIGRLRAVDRHAGLARADRRHHGAGNQVGARLQAARGGRNGVHHLAVHDDGLRGC